MGRDDPHLISPSHLVAATLLTAGLGSLYWQYRVARASRTPNRLLRALPVVGPILLMKDVAGLRPSDDSSSNRIARELIGLSVLQLSYGIVAARGLFEVTSAHASAGGGLWPIWYSLTHTWWVATLLLICAGGAALMSDVQLALRRRTGLQPYPEPPMYYYLRVDLAAGIGAISISTVLLASRSYLWLIVLTAATGAIAYVNGYRQTLDRPVRSTLGSIAFYARICARQGGLLAATGLLVLTALVSASVFKDHDEYARGYEIGVFADPSLLRRRETTTIVPSIVHNRLRLTFSVPLSQAGQFAFVVTKFAAKVHDDGSTEERRFSATVPSCVYTAARERNDPADVPLFRSGTESEFVFMGEPFVHDIALSTIECVFTDDDADVSEDTFTRRSVIFSLASGDDAFIPMSLERFRSDVEVDLDEFLADEEVTLFGGRGSVWPLLGPRTRILTASAPRSASGLRTEQEITAVWTQRGRPELRDSLLLVLGSLLGLAFVCILEWLRPRIRKIAKDPF